MKKWALNEATLPIKPVKDFPFTRTDKVFFDANVWLYIYFSSASSRNSAEAAYSAAWQDILTAQSNVYIDALIVSEIINAHARSRYRIRKIQGASFRDFKAFRKSSDFRPVADEIAFQVKRILSRCTLIESGFSSLRMHSLLDVYAQGDVDFNDQIFVEICRANDYLFVTNDGDFADADISVLTANRKLLRRAAQPRSANQ